jgi:peptidoglycan/xylan/chitin deacetylase (PgdA/CDA1 family)
MGLLTRVSTVAGRALSWMAGLAARLSSRRAGLVLVYHSLAEHAGDPRRELVPAHAAAAFERQVRLLRSRYRVVRAEELRSAVARRRRGARFPVAVTFDDDLASHAVVAAPILSRHGIQAAFFLGGASLDGPAAYWWQYLQRAVDRGLPGWEGDVHEQAQRIEALSGHERAAIAARLEVECDAPDDPGLRAAEMRLLAEAGFDVGFHTLRHERLTDLDDDGLAAALVEGRERLERELGRSLTMIAYPHGKADRRVAAAAREAGYTTGFTGSYGPVRADTDPLLMSRIEPTFGTVEAFAFQLLRALARPAHP